jgi:NhaA family Na+:H+ antiporter
VRYVPVYALLGIGVWLATLESGVHATIARVALGLLAPARPFLGRREAAVIAAELSRDRNVTVADVRRVSFRVKESVSVAERLQDLLHPWTSYLIVPLFALANAGVVLSRTAMADAATSTVTLGIVLGLFVGKPVGIAGAVALATRLRLAALPAGVRRRHITGLGILAGIGFTVSLFIAGLAFETETLATDAKLGILAGSACSALIGMLVLRWTGARARAR